MDKHILNWKFVDKISIKVFNTFFLFNLIVSKNIYFVFFDCYYSVVKYLEVFYYKNFSCYIL